MAGGRGKLAWLCVHRRVCRRGLVCKQGLVITAIALLVGLLSSAFEISRDLEHERRQVGRTTVQILTMVNAAASEAAFQMNTELAARLVASMQSYDLIHQVTLRDNFGTVMAHQDRPPVRTPLTWLANRLFADSTEFLLPLFYRTGNGVDQAVGEISVSLDAGQVARGFFSRAGVILITDLARAAAVCGLCVVAFSVMLTRPLLRLQAAIGQVDPAAPGRAPLPVRPKRTDELDDLAATLARLLAAFQQGLDDRDAAEAELKEMARTLEQRVHDRTEELAREKASVEQALEQLNTAHGELNKATHHISESIRYASRIQSSLLPDNSSLTGFVHDIAIGWEPRDVVGGDFYWIGRFGDRCVLALMDCTGHGVPGAFMTAIVASVLDRILHEHCHDDPAMILQLLNRLVKSSLRQDGRNRPGETGSDDGLDAAICLIDNQRGLLTFAGANIPLLLAEGGELRLIKGDRHSLGYRASRADYLFTNHVIPLQSGMSCYLFTDGVTDQVGGVQRRLFGRRRLLEVLAEGMGLPMAEQRERLFHILAEYRGVESRRDDMTFIGFTPLPPSVSRWRMEPPAGAEAQMS